MVKGKAGDAQTPPRQAPKKANGEAKKSTTAELAAEGKKLADELEKTPPPAGDNAKPKPESLLITDAAEQATYYYEVTRKAMRLKSQIKELKDEIKEIADEEKQLYKEGKARLGFNRADFEHGIMLKASADEDGGGAAYRTWKRQQQIAIWEAHPIGIQSELPLEGGAQAPDRTPSVDRAFEEGLMVGRIGEEPCTPPSHYGQAQAQSWMQGWTQGNQERLTLKNKLRPLEDQGTWPDDKDVLAAAADGIGDAAKAAVSNVIPIGTAPATSEAV